MSRLLVLALLLAGCSKKAEDPYLVELRKLAKQICDCQTSECTQPLMETRKLMNKDLKTRFGEIEKIPVDLLEKEQRIDEEISHCVKLVTP